MSRQRKAERIPPGPPGGAGTVDNSQLWLTRAALGLAGLALVGIAAFLLGHQQGADSVVEALQSQGVQTLPQEPDTYPTDEQESADEAPGDEVPVEEETPAEQDEASEVEAVDTEYGGLDEDWGVDGDDWSAVEVGDDSSGVAVDTAQDAVTDTAAAVVAVNATDAAATTPVGDSGAPDTPTEPVDAPEADAWVMALEPETAEPETAEAGPAEAEAAVPEAGQPEAGQPEAEQPGTEQPGTEQPDTALPEPVEPQFAEPVAREEVVQGVQPEPYVQAEPVGTPTSVAELALYSVDPQQVDADPGQVEPQEIGSHVLGTVGADETVLVVGG